MKPLDLSNTKRIVVKIGSALLTDTKKGTIKSDWLQSLVKDIAHYSKKENIEFVIVSSGSISLGRKYIQTSKQELRLEEKQAAAACGQAELVRHFQKAFHKYKRHAAQILLTLQDSENRRNYLNAKNTIETLLANNIIPVINENDTVTTQEIRFGDNDRLAARVAQMVSADLLILLSDIDGLYTSNPLLNKDAQHIDIVKKITKSIQKMAGTSLSDVGSGGMITKIEAATIATQNGCNMTISKGNIKHPIRRLFNGAKHTFFHASKNHLSAKKLWFYSSLSVSGKIIIDDGAYKALLNGGSLLPAGVIDVKGDFERGDIVSICNNKSEEIGRGLVAHSSQDANLMKGHQTADIEHIIGLNGRNALIHSDDLVVAIDEQSTPNQQNKEAS